MKPIEGSVVSARAYWTSCDQMAHPECLDAGFKQEAYECQKLDADCNDCMYFHANVNGRDIRRGTCGRGAKHPDLPVQAIDALVGGWPNVVARPVFCSGYPCFVHRRDAILR